MKWWREMMYDKMYGFEANGIALMFIITFLTYGITSFIKDLIILF